MPSTRRQKAKARKSGETDILSDIDNLDVMLGNGDSNPIEREFADAIEQSSVQGDTESNTHLRDQYASFTYENNLPRQNDVRQFFPLFKKGDRSNPENYRPISLLSSASKIFEKVICKRMTKFFKKNESFTPNQYGFRNKRSCTHAIGEVLDYIRNEMDKRNAGSACFIDLKNTFDTLDHKILLQKLEKYGFRGKILCLLTNYLENRQQYVEHNQIRSSTKELKTGVPQGSVLGPFLFLIYINDLPLVFEKSKISLFADDTTVYNMGMNSEKEITEDVRKMRNWFDVNKLTLNVEKCESISFGRAQPVSEETFGEKISCKSSCKYLGVIIDNKLNFKDHVEYVSKKLNKFCGLVYRIRHLYPLHCLLLFYKSYAKPLITYGLLNYGIQPKRIFNLLKMHKGELFEQCFSKKNLNLSKILLRIKNS